MKKTVPFELFDKNQYLMFDILRLAALETSLGQSLPTAFRAGNAGVNFCLAALPIGLAQHYHKPTPAMFVEKIENYLDNGGTLDEIATPILRAIIATGIMGSEPKAEGTEADENQKNE